MSESSLFSGRTLIVAFEGWNDAGEAASATARLLVKAIAGYSVHSIDSQSYYDYQFARPQVFLNALGKREFKWPTATIFRPELPDLFDLRVLLGVEPSRNWIEFSKEIADAVEAEEIDSVIFLGAMLADAPHTRPVVITSTTTNDAVALETSTELSMYEGPVGILSVLAAEFEAKGIPTLFLWAAVPHYVHNGPVPKATLALVTALEKQLNIEFDHGELANDVFSWERAVDELAEGDEDLAEYVAALENTRDEIDGATGDTIAAEVEKFLRDSDDDR